MLQGLMKCARVLASAVTAGVLTVSLPAQQVAVDTVAESSAPALVVREAAHVSIPAPPPQHKFFDGQQLLALYAHSGMRTVDTIKTCRELSHGGHEDWIPTQSCAGIAAWQVGSIGLALGVGWMFHRHGHHRLERITPWVATSASAAGWTKSVLNIK
jgi:hypothetical protein